MRTVSPSNLAAKTIPFRVPCLKARTHHLRQAHRFVNGSDIAEGYRFVVDLDLENFSIGLIMIDGWLKIAERISDKRLLKLIRSFLQAGVMENGLVSPVDGGETPSVLERLEEWIRRRLPAAIWKQWKHGPKRFAELQKRGVGKDLAAKAAGSAHGPWQLANSPALAIALPNAYFATLEIPR